MNNNAIKQSGAYLEIVSFHLGDQEFCIDIMAIREIRGWAPGDARCRILRLTCWASSTYAAR